MSNAAPKLDPVAVLEAYPAECLGFMGLDNGRGRRCALGALLHGAGLTTKEIQQRLQSQQGSYAEMFPELTDFYGLAADDISSIWGINDDVMHCESFVEYGYEEAHSKRQQRAKSAVLQFLRLRKQAA